MNFKSFPYTGKQVWQNNKPFLWFILCLLGIHFILKIIFYNYNYQLLFTGAENVINGTEKLKLLKWSAGADLLVVFGINAFLLFALTAGRLVNIKFSQWVTIPFFVLLNSFAILLNLADIFYFRFHFQRANADLLYVLDHPFNRLFQQNIFIVIVFFTLLIAVIYIVWLLHNRFFNAYSKGSFCYGFTTLLFIILGIAVLNKKHAAKLFIPTYPMLQLKAIQLPVVQNSFHCFLYSVFRNGSHLPTAKYMSDVECDSLMPLKKQLNLNNTDSIKKNIVLFIMESVPYDFFDTASEYKVAMPFFDSLVKKSIFFNNAFAYSHESNKGITAILAGIPTITDIPVYHSQYINMPITHVGKALQQLNYSSFFCIGDEYDNFGFAKCMNWLGIEKYYSNESIPGYKKLPMHSMGLQDGEVLPFFKQKINEQTGPFFAINYNISTHYPYDIPKNFTSKLPSDYTDPMKSMAYYDYSLGQFFESAQKENWFANTVFIFCSDHWLVPNDKKVNFNAVSGYRIPIIIYDASANKRETVSQPVSQFDIMGTVLGLAGYQDSIISYGGNLLDNKSLNNFSFSKPSNAVYQVTDSAFVLGYNIFTDKVEYLYNYKKDVLLKENLLSSKTEAKILSTLTRQIQAFVQQAQKQFTGY